ncbi:MAG TPA: alanine--tRNA ligase [Bacteroidales bacterium]|nr:alanine--tRNA ligase [Bacteroidales bacterium]HPO65993.1 alanine--tRNA ligase [Bacteroidales bacterium]
MNSNQVREKFLEFFRTKQHEIVPSAPMVVKNDPTLMFTNAGMNQFKDIFLGNEPPRYKRVANTQKCLRVSGKHNDLEEVGHDTYHHTMFEMLGNWSFGDYFKREAIDWAWEFLTEWMKIDKDRLYVTIFKGDASEGLERDEEAYQCWLKNIASDRILDGSKKDNFWEMGDTGPCGPCSEIHIDLRDDAERKQVDGKTLVNTGHPLVIEIWNIVFIQYNRKANGQLEKLPATHVDTGMGFERLCMVVQNKKSNYDTDVFSPIIHEIERLTGLTYGSGGMTDVAMRVVADHLRAVSFAIADGQLPSNNKAGYVIRRILRRAVRYAYTYLNQSEPFLCKLVPTLASHMGGAFPELKAQQKLIIQVLTEEEYAFLKTLATGIRLLDQIMADALSRNQKTISGVSAFELYDTYGFPLDLTELIAREKGLTVNRQEFDQQMEQQKNRSRMDAQVDTDDWVVLRNDESNEFVGYDMVECPVHIVRYRKVTTKGKNLYQLVLDKTPFYAESGGQVGDRGVLEGDSEQVVIMDTKKENNLILHLTEKLPSDLTQTFIARVNLQSRRDAEANHSATHLLHLALRTILGKHVEQKGSLVHPDYLRFDFSHFQKLSPEEIEKIEDFVNERIRANIALNENRAMPFDEAIKMGAMALFGEKYGDKVRVVRFGDSIELCGGTHVKSTGQIGFFKIISESAIAAGIRRIEAITGRQFAIYQRNLESQLNEIKSLLNHPQDVVKQLNSVLSQMQQLQKRVEQFKEQQLIHIKNELLQTKREIQGINVIKSIVQVDSADDLKTLAFQLKGQVSNLFLVLGAEVAGKANLLVFISENLVKEKQFNAVQIVKDIALEIQGGGGGQPFLATAGGKNPSGLEKAVEAALKYLA